MSTRNLNIIRFGENAEIKKSSIVGCPQCFIFLDKVNLISNVNKRHRMQMRGEALHNLSCANITMIKVLLVSSKAVGKLRDSPKTRTFKVWSDTFNLICFMSSWALWEGSLFELLFNIQAGSSALEQWYVIKPLAQSQKKNGEGQALMDELPAVSLCL